MKRLESAILSLYAFVITFLGSPSVFADAGKDEVWFKDDWIPMTIAGVVIVGLLLLLFFCLRPSQDTSKKKES